MPTPIAPHVRSRPLARSCATRVLGLGALLAGVLGVSSASAEPPAHVSRQRRSAPLTIAVRVVGSASVSFATSTAAPPTVACRSCGQPQIVTGEPIQVGDRWLVVHTVLF